jgi:putative hydrolase of the HAD superfamily
VLEAVLFDWGHTLIDFRWDAALLEAGYHAGLDAIGLEQRPDVDAIVARFEQTYWPLIWAPGTIEEVEYPGLVRELLGHFGVEVSDDELARFLEAEHDAWVPAQVLHATSHALLDSLRERGLKLGLVSNAFDPGWLLHRDLDAMGLAERLDFAVFSSEIGRRKPDPAIFLRALEALDVAPERTLFVGDRLFEDVRGAAQVGMRTVQALWFRADEHPEGGLPDHQAFTQMDVLNIARRLAL